MVKLVLPTLVHGSMEYISGLSVGTTVLKPQVGQCGDCHLDVLQPERAQYRQERGAGV